MSRNVLNFVNKNIPVLPQRLREAREVLEMTMIDLASRIGITRQAISLYEAGERTPEPDIMMKIVQELKQPISFFIAERPQSFGNRDTIYFRSFSKKTKRTNRHCEILSTWISELAFYVNKFVNIPSVNLPEIAPPLDGLHYRSDEIEAAATKCRRLWGLNDGPIGNMVSLLEYNGIIVAKADLNVNTVDAFSYWEGGHPFIFLGKSSSSACRSRFDIAHELGHLILHRGISTLDLESNLKTIEKEANQFASNFLLPRSTYSLEIFSTRIPAFVELKKRWKVSISAQIFRCFELGIINDEQHLNLRKQISARNWRKSEPLDKEIEIEFPQIIKKSFKLLIDKNIRTSSEILSDIKLSKDNLEQIIDIKFDMSDYRLAPTIDINSKYT